MRGFLTALALTVMYGTGAAAVSLSMNEVELAAGTDLAACKQMGRDAFRRTGLLDAGESPASVFGEGADGLIAAVYCLPHRGIAMIGIAGASPMATRPVLAALLAAMK